MRLSGGRPRARSLKTSTSMPPRRTGSPARTGDRPSCRRSTRSPCSRIIGCTVTPSKAPGLPSTMRRWLSDGREGGADGRLVGEVELHAADVALVRDGRGQQLEHDRIADLPGGGDGLVGGPAGDRRRRPACRRRPALPWPRPRSAGSGRRRGPVSKIRRTRRRVRRAILRQRLGGVS